MELLLVAIDRALDPELIHGQGVQDSSSFDRKHVVVEQPMKRESITTGVRADYRSDTERFEHVMMYYFRDRFELAVKKRLYSCGTRSTPCWRDN